MIHLKLRAAEIPSSAQFEQTLQPGNFTIADLTKIIVIIERENNVKQGPKEGHTTAIRQVQMHPINKHNTPKWRTAWYNSTAQFTRQAYYGSDFYHQLYRHGLIMQ